MPLEAHQFNTHLATLLIVLSRTASSVVRGLVRTYGCQFKPVLVRDFSVRLEYRHPGTGEHQDLCFPGVTQADPIQRAMDLKRLTGGTQEMVWGLDKNQLQEWAAGDTDLSIWITRNTVSLKAP